MLELAAELLPLLQRGESIAVVTVAAVARSSPRGVGASMAVSREGRVIGSISGGCVEADAVALALAVLGSGRPGTADLGYSDDAAHAAGLACGGSVTVAAFRVTPDDTEAIGALQAAAGDRPVDVEVVLAGSDAGRIRTAAPDSSADVPRSAYNGSVVTIAHRPKPPLIIVGAGEHAAALCRVAAAAGYAVTVCDVWELLATPDRFPDAARIVVGLPHEHLARLDPATVDPRTAICVLSHDERVDVPAIDAALRLPVGFVGAMGARSTVTHRAALFRARGIDEASLARLHSPLGLDLGGASPEEAAVAVLAEIQAMRHGASTRSLRELDGPLHARHGAPADAATTTDAAMPRTCATPVRAEVRV